MCVTMKHQSISRWLSQLGLPEYCPALEQEYDGVEDLLHLSEYDLLELGVHNHLHRLHLLTSLRLLQERERRRDLRMMAEGRFASLPRSLHAHHTLAGGPAHPGVPSNPLQSTCSSRGLQASLSSSMDLLSSRPGVPPGPGSSLSQLSTSTYQPVSIHGTLPRRKRGGANLNHDNATWDPRANHMQQIPWGKASLVPGHAHQPMTSPLVQNIIDDCHGYREPAAGLDATVDYVKFSRDQFIVDCPSEKLRKELEEELKMNCEEPRSHAWYHGAIPRQVAEYLVQRDGDFLIRDSLSSPGSYVLTCQWRNAAQHFKINKKVVMLNEAYSRVEYRLEREGFDNVPALIRYYVGNRKSVSQVVGAIIFQPINRGLPLRCLEEKYGLSSHRRDALMAQERRSRKRLSLNVTNGHAQDDARGAQNGARGRDDGGSPSSQLRFKDRCGSQPASLNQVPERRRPLQAHQSESYLPLGSKPQRSPDPLLPSPSPKSPVFRTGSEPVLSPSVPRRPAELLAGQAIRGSDSQLCPKPPPKPSKVPLARLRRSPCLQPPAPPPGNPGLAHATSASSGSNAPALASACVQTLASPRSSEASAGPPVPPVKPLKFLHQLRPEDTRGFSTSALSPAENVRGSESEENAGRTDRLQASPADLRSRSPLEWRGSNPLHPATDVEMLPPLCSHVERLRREGEAGREEEEEEEAGGSKGLDRSSYHHAIAALENTSEEEGEEEEEEEEEGEDKRSRFQRPVEETESAFQPAQFGSRLLPPENKPLETVVLKRAKELLLSHDHHSIARHLLMADCQVARTVGVTPEVKGQMGVSSGLELVTLPHGRQLRLDLMERHHTMAIGVAVDILGCTGSVDERASTLNRIILVALELKDAVGDLFAFTALMKALDLPQISRLEETWTTLRRTYTQTAISYEKTLKPFYKNLYEGTASSPAVVCVPLLLPLLTLMERPSITPEGAELWETSDQGCDIMLRHLEDARDVAHNAQRYAINSQMILEGFPCDEDLLEVFKTDFQLRLLWGSRGASVNQSDRYNKFNLILTALSRKLEPPPNTQIVI